MKYERRMYEVRTRKTRPDLRKQSEVYEVYEVNPTHTREQHIKQGGELYVTGV